MAETKTRPTAISPAAFIADIEDEQARQDSTVLVGIMGQVTGEPAIMWGPAIIGFGQYHYKYESGREGDMCLTGFSPRKGKLTLYVLSSFEGQEEILSRLGKHKTGGGCLYIKKLADIDLDVLKELISSSFEFSKKKQHS